jgi:hypothetical protein
MTRQAISPRFAISIFLNMDDLHQTILCGKHRGAGFAKPLVLPP